MNKLIILAVLITFHTSEAQKQRPTPVNLTDFPPIFLNQNEIEELRNKLNDKIKSHIYENFDETVKHKIGVNEKIRATIIFVLSKKSTIKDINVKSKHKEIVSELERVLKLLPPFLPAYLKGQPVDTIYALPIRI